MMKKKRRFAIRGWSLGKDIIKNLKKDFRIECRNRYSLNMALSFGGISVIAISLVSSGIPFTVPAQSILLWLIIFFSAMNSMPDIFVREIEQNTVLFLKLNASAETVLTSKMIYNILFFCLMLLVITPLYVFFLQVEVKSLMLFILTILTGGFSIASSTTLLSAMISKAGGKASLFTVISFPVQIPVLWVLISLTNLSLSQTGQSLHPNLLFLLAFSCILIALSFLLFKSIWLEE